jgi:hypothetical protein
MAGIILMVRHHDGRKQCHWPKQRIRHGLIFRMQVLHKRLSFLLPGRKGTSEKARRLVGLWGNWLRPGFGIQHHVFFLRARRHGDWGCGSRFMERK